MPFRLTAPRQPSTLSAIDVTRRASSTCRNLHAGSEPPAGNGPGRRRAPASGTERLQAHLAPALRRSLLALLSVFLAASGSVAPAADAPTTPTPPAQPVPAAPEGETLAVRQLRQVIERENRTWERLRANPDNEATKRRVEAELLEVIGAYENILRANPDFAEAYAAYGLLLSRTGSREAAAKAFLKANELNPNIPMVKNQLGNYLVEDGKYQEALPYYLAAIELKPDEPLYHYQLGTLLHEFRRFFIADGTYTADVIAAKSHEAFKRAAELAPDTWAYAYRYAESFYDAADPDWEAALAEWRKLEAKAEPGVGVQTIRLHIARVLIEMGGHDDEARAIVATVTEPALAENKQTLVDYLNGARKE